MVWGRSHFYHEVADRPDSIRRLETAAPWPPAVWEGFGDGVKGLGTESFLPSHFYREMADRPVSARRRILLIFRLQLPLHCQLPLQYHLISSVTHKILRKHHKEPRTGWKTHCTNPRLPRHRIKQLPRKVAASSSHYTHASFETSLRGKLRGLADTTLLHNPGDSC